MIEEIVKSIEQRFQKEGKQIAVKGTQTLELYDCNLIITQSAIAELVKSYLYSRTNTTANEQYKPATQEDEIEREQILDFFHDEIKIFDDEHTRQAVYQPKYEGNKKLAACLSCLQLIIRDGKLDCHVFIRSQNFDKNFVYDCITFSILINSIAFHLKKEVGTIHLKIISLHKIL